MPTALDDDGWRPLDCAMARITEVLVSAAPPKPPLRGARVPLTVVHAGVTYRIAVKRVASARRFTLRVRTATQDAVLTMPPRASLKTALSFAERHAEWIGERLSQLPAPRPIAAGARVPVRGVEHLIAHDAAALRRQPVVLPAPDGSAELRIRVGGRPEHVGAAVLAFLRREALRDLTEAARRHAATVGKTIARISLRDTRSRWGSCSSRGTLSFSWRLVMAPPAVLDYLAAHEVAHLVHMDHSAAFWAVARRLAPQTDEAEAWLRRHGPALHRYAPA